MPPCCPASPEAGPSWPTSGKTDHNFRKVFNLFGKVAKKSERSSASGEAECFKPEISQT